MYRDIEIHAGQELSMAPNEHAKFASLGFVEAYETKVRPAPEKKTLESSLASPAAPALRRKTSKKRTAAAQ